MEIQYWLKSMHDRPERRKAGYWAKTTWINDAHRMKDGEPKNRPRYRPGDLIVMYLTGIGRCPALARVTSKPDFNPGQVDRGQRPGDGQQWGWVTNVEMLRWTDVDLAPSRADIGVDGRSVQRHSRIHLSPEQFRAAEKLIPAGN